jgi:hypothetical protein
MYTFSYSEFYDYYTNPNNLITGKDIDCVSLHYFNNDTNNKQSKKTNPKCEYIIVSDVKIYVSQLISKTTNKKGITEIVNGLMFSVQIVMDDIPFDFHYYFGKRGHKEYTKIQDKHYMEKQKTKMIGTIRKRISKNNTKKIRQKLSTPYYSDLQEFYPNIDLLTINSDEKIIFFHKTIQHHTGTNSDNIPEGYREHQNCYFRDNTKIKDIHNIVCVDKDEYVMGNRFLHLLTFQTPIFHKLSCEKYLKIYCFYTLNGRQRIYKKIRRRG